ncbi:hypothetical protein JOC77_003342 [Peribacillus deserti]|uniref:Uncharacterized protein n=1 Tax=Peribacillus deserti TaxID=673318 RepID=A0ABS2QL55_9BACI|nr:hypothetical protein [Peribacillus deserti]
MDLAFLKVYLHAGKTMLLTSQAEDGGIYDPLVKSGFIYL